MKPQSASVGMLLRFFVHFYDMEIIEEEAFLAWKEDITQEFPGKGKALFQVHLLPLKIWLLGYLLLHLQCPRTLLKSV